MRRATLVAAAVVAAGCARKQPDTAIRTVPATTRVGTAAGAIDLATVSTAEAVGVVVDARPPRAWEVLPAVYKQLEVPVTTFKADEYLLGNPGAKFRRRLGGVPMQQYLDCGSASGGPNAETYEITMALHTQLVPTPDGTTRVLTLIDASAVPPTVSAGAAVRCVSTGKLERRVAALVAEHVRP